MLSDLEIRAIAQEVVNEAKRTSKYEQGTLRRSIRYTVEKGVYVFRQIFYGQFNENSKLESIARRLMPYGVEYKIILVDMSGKTYEAGRTKGGRATQKSAIAAVSNSSSSNIRALLTSIRKKKKKDGDKED